MTTEVANRSANALAAIGALKTGLQNVQSSAPMASGGDDILKMDTHGVWMFGADNVKVEQGSHWAGNPLSIRHGYVCWKYVPQGSKEKREKLGEKVYSMNEQLPPVDSLPDLGKEAGNEWKQFMSIQMKCMDGSDEGQQVLYAPSSGGGIDAFVGRDRSGGFVAAIVKQADKNPDAFIPVFTLSSDSYVNTTHGGSTFFPIFTIVDWMAYTEFADLEEEAAAPAAEAPKTAEVPQARRTRAAASEKPAPVQEESPLPDEDDGLTAEEREVLAKIAARKAGATAQQQPPATQAAAETAPAAGEVRRRRRA